MSDNKNQTKVQKMVGWFFGFMFEEPEWGPFLLWISRFAMVTFGLVVVLNVITYVWSIGGMLGEIGFADTKQIVRTVVTILLTGAFETIQIVASFALILSMFRGGAFMFIISVVGVFLSLFIDFFTGMEFFNDLADIKRPFWDRPNPAFVAFTVLFMVAETFFWLSKVLHDVTDAQIHGKKLPPYLAHLRMGKTTEEHGENKQPSQAEIAKQVSAVLQKAGVENVAKVINASLGQLPNEVKKALLDALGFPRRYGRIEWFTRQIAEYIIAHPEKFPPLSMGIAKALMPAPPSAPATGAPASTGALAHA